MDRVNLSTPETVETLRRSVAMLGPGQPALDREQATAVLGALGAALEELAAAAEELRGR